MDFFQKLIDSKGTSIHSLYSLIDSNQNFRIILHELKKVQSSEL